MEERAVERQNTLPCIPSSALEECLGVGYAEHFRVELSSCSGLRNRYPGVPSLYVFCENGKALYVGETGDTSRRIYREHCSAHIGGSEGVVRFLMYYLDRIAEALEEWVGLSPPDRERYVKEFLKRKVRRLTLVLILDSEGRLRDGRRRREVEKCLRVKLKPLLNPV